MTKPTPRTLLPDPDTPQGHVGNLSFRQPSETPLKGVGASATVGVAEMELPKTLAELQRLLDREFEAGQAQESACDYQDGYASCRAELEVKLQREYETKLAAALRKAQKQNSDEYFKLAASYLLSTKLFQQIEEYAQVLIPPGTAVLPGKKPVPLKQFTDEDVVDPITQWFLEHR
jgi:hypothetical protein